MTLKTYTVGLELGSIDAEDPNEAVRNAFATMRQAPDFNFAFDVTDETTGVRSVVCYQDAAAGHHEPQIASDLIEAARDAAATLDSLMAHYGTLMPEADRRGREQTLADLREAIARSEPDQCGEPADGPGT